uniref:Uncharacterized protein n=1 Tax=Rhizophora mucronata TaxID=61149 RepID=A0A2P2NLA3_RHIMU
MPKQELFTHQCFQKLVYFSRRIQQIKSYQVCLFAPVLAINLGCPLKSASMSADTLALKICTASAWIRSVIESGLFYISSSISGR